MLKLLVCACAITTQAQRETIQPRQINVPAATNGKGKQSNNVNNNNNNNNNNYNNNNFNSNPQPLQQNSVSVGLFKNGYAFYVRQGEVSGDGVYTLDLPSTVHGTLSVSSSAKDVSVSTQYQTVSVPAPLSAASFSLSNLQAAFAGKQVTFQIRDSNPVTGTLAKLAPSEQLLSAPRARSSLSYYSSLPASPPTTLDAPADFLVVEDGQGGMTLVDPSQITSVRVEGGATPTRDEKQLTITVQGTRDVSPIQISYLSYGLTWAPSYHLNLTNPYSLFLTFQATIRNEGTALNATELSVISGFPNLEFQGVSSLLDSDLNTFISNVNSPSAGSSSGILSQSVTSNSAYGMAQNVETNRVETADSDILYQSLGGVNLPAKSAIMRTVSSASVNFQPVVEWDGDESDAWDAVRFLNPLSTAMTSAPASVVQNSRLLGQSTTKWTPPRGLAIVRTSKALSVRVWKSEIQGEELPLPPARAKLVQVTVDGVLNVANSRNANITMCLNYGFDGVLVPSNANIRPTVSSVEGGAGGGLNARTSVNWEFVLRPGEKVAVPFAYTYKKRTYY